ncbi:acyl carrier protein [Psychromicrobium lacuslunae]|uniref:Acyl carrier protein n=1 Tax=Psychromicrobium lacuslunae TaxID=1618207 RepID=A0A0D4C1M8_9MICC|nr:acyl carrier protein [Psychromicrobium lacuslunae]AJT42567.1 acyl carrier protein [Psychromicrobium lacuslunae]
MESVLGEKIREILANHGKLAVDIAEITDTSDLYAAGMTSHASVNVMLALEDTFDLEFPEKMLTKATFSSVQSIAEALTEIGLD